MRSQAFNCAPTSTNLPEKTALVDVILSLYTLPPSFPYDSYIEKPLQREGGSGNAKATLSGGDFHPPGPSKSQREAPLSFR
jgi:hypothetical protein